MSKVQNDFYFKWAGSRIVNSTSSAYSFDDKIEYLVVDTTVASGDVNVTLPEIDNSLVVDGKRIYIADSGNASVNNIILLPNGSDGSTINGNSSFYITVNNSRVIVEVVAGAWVVVASFAEDKNYGAFNMVENTNVTAIAAVSTPVDINGSAVNSPNNNGFTFTTSPNALESTFSGSYVGFLSASATIERNSGAALRDVALLLFQDTGSGYVQVSNAAAEIAAGNGLRNVSFSTLVNVSFGDKFKLMVENRQSTNNLIIGDLSLTIGEL